MPKISSYGTTTPVLTDKLIGTDVGGTPADSTKNFLLSDIQALFNLTTNTLSDVLTAGNTATNNIILTGNITCTLLTTTNLAVSGHIDGTGLSINLLPVYADNAAALAGGLVAKDLYSTATGELRIVV